MSEFFSRLDLLLERCGQLNEDRVGQYAQKAILSSAIDAMSAVRYPEINGNRTRFTTFVKNDFGWHCASLVSLPHLDRAFSINESVPPPELDTYLEPKRAAWIAMASSGGYLPAGLDLDLQEISTLIPSHLIPREGRWGLERLTHSHLLYNYRCTLVHELRVASEIPEWLDETEAYYMDWSADSSTDWHLVYPLYFIKKYVKKTRAQLENYLLRNGIDPDAMLPNSKYMIDS